MTTLFSTPLPAHQHNQFTSTPSSSNRKRKRNAAQSEEDKELRPVDNTSPSNTAPALSNNSVPEEYSAVISPQEREQRKLSKYSLTDPLPAFPFPHAPYPPTHLDHPHEATRKPYTPIQYIHRAEANNNQQSLRSQHLAAMSAVLHKSLQNKDYIRASRALGLILRTDINGRPVDIRAAGNWAVGAEILFRRDLQYRRQHPPNHSTRSHSTLDSLPFTTQGFKQAKDLYENLIIQHPYDKSWPDTVNAINFHLAMFSLWIYVAQAEATQQLLELDTQQLSDPSLDYVSSLRDIKRSQLRRANEIEQRIEKSMSSTIYRDNTDLLRMRAMLALWRADLSDASQDAMSMDVTNENADLVENAESVADAVSNLAIGDSNAFASNQLTRSALEARKLAHETFKRLGIDQQDDD